MFLVGSAARVSAETALFAEAVESVSVREPVSDLFVVLFVRSRKYRFGYFLPQKQILHVDTLPGTIPEVTRFDAGPNIKMERTDYNIQTFAFLVTELTVFFGGGFST